MKTVEDYVKEYGEAYKGLIISALAFLDKNEPLLKLPEPIQRDNYIAALIVRATEGFKD